MKKFTKLALVSSLAISANAMAMQAMDDASLGATTGQDGINIGIGITKIEIEKLLIHDNDGLAANAKNTVNGTSVTGITASGPTFAPSQVISDKAIDGGTDTAGALVIKGNGVAGHVNQNAGIVITANNSALLDSHNLADLQIDSDAGANGAFLNVAAQVSGLEINIGKIAVAASGTSTTGRRGSTGTENDILTGLKITTGQMAANIQLGSTPQGAMIKLDTTMKGGLTISDLGILDNAGGGQVTLGKISVNDAAGPDLTISSDISVTQTGLSIKSNQNAAGTDIYVQGINLGAAPAGTLGARGTSRLGSIGDMEVQGLKTWSDGAYSHQGSIITVSGR
ncbi:pilus assembly protein FilA [Acinetobacter sp. NIPH 2377]|uniref:putative pilus system protein FilA n=1 Tax=Acinetobacter terrestris TaxID=2529843 RepID=UPI00149002FE|nr:DUF6160 family protein [Acinetobacter terrestris]NNH36084.1 pilus assembly protein FilA [Acinetobacter terrestris]